VTGTASGSGKISVVLPCADEGAYTRQTVMSFCDRTEPEVLQEIIVVDDGSSPRLTEVLAEVPEHCRLRVLRHEHTLGLMIAKQTGGDAATGFFDCHVAPNVGWHQEMIQLLRAQPIRLVVPIITDLDLDTWDERKASAVNSKCYIDWNCDFMWFEDNSDFIPVVSGGLVATSQLWWRQSGGFDRDMRGWGGENVDQSLRAWLCGGDIWEAGGVPKGELRMPVAGRPPACAALPCHAPSPADAWREGGAEGATPEAPPRLWPGRRRAKTRRSSASRVAHMWRVPEDQRTKAHYTPVRGVDNLGRVAAAWFDDFAVKFKGGRLRSGGGSAGFVVVLVGGVREAVARAVAGAVAGGGVGAVVVSAAAFVPDLAVAVAGVGVPSVGSLAGRAATRDLDPIEGQSVLRPGLASGPWGRFPGQAAPRGAAIAVVGADLKCKPFSFWLHRFRKIYRDGGMLPSEVWKLRSRETGKCVRKQGDKMVLASCDARSQLFHLANRDPARGDKCCSGIRLWNSLECFDRLDRD
ncbi:unnamed protein product, partial [Prorocentrum cordatum]